MASDRPEVSKPGQTWPAQHPNAPAPGERAMGPYPQQARVQLTNEERIALRQCSTESFWYRCVPLGALFVGTTQILVNRGILTPHPRYGATLKSMGAVMVAYLLGKVSYQGKCRAKIMALENSPLAEAMRRGKQGQLADMTAPFGAQAPPAFQEANLGAMGRASSKPREDGLNMEIDTESSRKEIKGLDESLRPSLDSDSHRNDRASSGPTNEVSYQELRRRNREDYNSRMTSQMAPPAPPPPSGQQPFAERRPTYSGPQSKPKMRTNKYGDVIEEAD